MSDAHTIRPLDHPAPEADVADLADLLLDAVDSGAAVSFVGTLTIDGARAWWRAAIASLHPRAVILIARDDRGVVGTVQLQPAWAPNQPHRAEVCKLIVHRRARGAGLGAQLMHAIEAHARRRGFRLLTLDAKAGGTADALYTRLGWVRVGTIPDFAFDTDGITLHDAVLFYRHLNDEPPSAQT